MTMNTCRAALDMEDFEMVSGGLREVIGDVYAKTGESWTADPFAEVRTGTEMLFKDIFAV